MSDEIDRKRCGTCRHQSCRSAEKPCNSCKMITIYRFSNWEEGGKPVDVNESLPQDGKYVLIHLTDKPWHDREDQTGVMWVVAKFVRLETEEIGNNQKLYRWNEFGPGDHCGQDVDYWMELPALPEKASENDVC